MTILTHHQCTEECRLYLRVNKEKTCMYEYHVNGKGEVILAPLGKKCPCYGKDVPRTPWPLMVDFEKIREKEGKLEKIQVA